MTNNRIGTLLLVLGLCVTFQNFTQAQANQYDPETTEELRIRSGLPNFFSKIANGEKVKVGFIGGSITANSKGKWSGKTFDWLQNEYPNVAFEILNVAVPGTPAPFGAFRIASEMLVHNPDIVFIEYRVNGLANQGIRGPEGMVRQIIKNNPYTDICFVYTINQNMIPKIRENQQPGVGEIFEEVANYYNLPSIDMGVEVVKMLDRGDLVFKSKKPVDGKLVFSKDGTHPIESGAEIYKRVVSRSLKAMEHNQGKLKRELPKPLDDLSFEFPSIHNIDEVSHSDMWIKIDTTKDASYLSARWRTKHVVGDAIATGKIGETLTFNWDGYLLCMSTLPQGDGTVIEVTTDDKEPEQFVFNQFDEDRYGSQMFYTPVLQNKQHTTTVKVIELPKDAKFYFGQFYTVKAL